MSVNPPGDNITQLLRAWSGGDASALNDAVPQMYAELRRIAGSRLRARQTRCTLDSTALVHEAYLRMMQSSPLVCQNRAHFFALASVLMRGILIDHMRAKHASKRGSAGISVTLSDLPGDLSLSVTADLLDVDSAINELGALYPRHATIVEMRFFGGLSIEEVAESLGISPATVKRDWTFAKTWMLRRLSQKA